LLVSHNAILVYVLIFLKHSSNFATARQCEMFDYDKLETSYPTKAHVTPDSIDAAI